MPGTDADLNVALERAGRVADFMEFGELLARDALAREESCGGHFREEYQTPDGEAKRDDEHFSHVAAWEYAGPDQDAGPERRAADVREREADGAELQVSVRSACERRHGRCKTDRSLHGVWLQQRIDRREPTAMNSPSTSGGRRTATDPGRMETYPADDVSPDMSFLEMLDVVNEELIKQGRGADRVRPRLPRGHLRRRAR